MGAIFSKNKNDSDDYEKILSELDNDIQQKEIQLTEIRVKDRRIGILWILYSIVLWTIYVFYYFYALHGKYLNAQTIALTVSPIVIGPFCIYYVRKGLKWIFNKRLSSIETSLVSLRKKQKLKVEELKKKTAYYSTKSLLERYDPTLPQKKELDEQKRKKMMEEQEKQKRIGAQQKQHPIPQYTQGQPSTNNMGIQGIQPLPMKSNMGPQQPQQWYDKLVDALVGDAGPETKYALICTHCYAHNGLVLPQEVDNIQYTCPHCDQFNPSRKSRMLHPDGPVLPTMSPTISEDGHHHHSDEVETVQKEGEKANITTESTSGESSSTTVTAGIEKEKAEEDLELRQRKTVATTTDSTN